jgi:hypothetical protein
MAPHVEFLPLLSTEDDFTAFKVLTFIDALDESGSVIEWYPRLKKDAGKPRVARAIKECALRSDRLDGAVSFRIPQMPICHDVFVTDTFKRLVADHHLTGFEMKAVWPPPDTSAERAKYLEKRAAKKRQRH